MKILFLSLIALVGCLLASCVTDDDASRGPQSNVSTQPWGGPIAGEGGAAFGGALERR